MTNISFKRKRWLLLLAGMIIEACTGIAYAWSVFLIPLMNQFNCSLQQVNLIYTANFWCSALGSVILGAWAKKKLSIWQEVFLGSLIYVSFVIASAFSTSYWMFFLFFGILRSFGTALVYPVLIAYAVELFPDKSGVASGLIAAGYGCGAVIWAPLATSLMQSSGKATQAILVLGIIYAVCMLPLSLVLRDVPDGFREYVTPAVSNNRKLEGNLLYNVNRNQMLKMPFFYLVFTGLVLSLSCGNLVMSQGSPIIRNVLGYTAESAAIVVSVMSVCNVIGRLLCGAFSDRIGKVRSMFYLLCITAVGMLGMIVLQGTSMFLLFQFLVIFSYGGQTCLIAPITAEVFGKEHVSENYSVMYCTFAMGSLTGPMLGSMVLQVKGYTEEFGFGMIISMFAAAVMWVIISKMKNQKDERKTLCG